MSFTDEQQKAIDNILEDLTGFSTVESTEIIEEVKLVKLISRDKSTLLLGREGRSDE